MEKDEEFKEQVKEMIDEILELVGSGIDFRLIEPYKPLNSHIGGLLIK